MKALLLSAYRKLDLTDLPIPQAGPGELLVKVAACGICGSDVHGYDGSSGRRIPPIVMGHEAAGVVARLGAGTSNFKLGDRVALDSTIHCGECLFCRRDEVNLCDKRQVLGVSCSDYYRAGAFAEFVVVPARIAYHLPENLSFVEAALLETVAVALHAVSLVQFGKEATSLVVGAGTIGILAQQALRAAGCSRVFVSDLDRTRLRLSKQLGATEVLQSGTDVASKVLEFTGGLGVDVVIEAVGNTAAICTSIDSVRKGGSIVLVGNITPEISIHLQKVVSRQICLQGSCASAGEFPRAIESIMKGEIKVKPLITATAPLADGPRWFERLYSHEPNLMKIILEPGDRS